jgi:hypothetical protein
VAKTRVAKTHVAKTHVVKTHVVKTQVAKTYGQKPMVKTARLPARRAARGRDIGDQALLAIVN